MVFRLARRVRELMTEPKKTNQVADFDPHDLATIRARLAETGVAPRDVGNVAYLVRLVVRDWANAIRAGERVDLRDAKRMIEARYTMTDVQQANVGFLDAETIRQLDVIYDRLNTPSLATLVTNNRHKTPNRRLLIFLAAKRYAENLPTDPTT